MDIKFKHEASTRKACYDNFTGNIIVNLRTCKNFNDAITHEVVHKVLREVMGVPNPRGLFSNIPKEVGEEVICHQLANGLITLKDFHTYVKDDRNTTYEMVKTFNRFYDECIDNNKNFKDVIK